MYNRPFSVIPRIFKEKFCYILQLSTAKKEDKRLCDEIFVN